MVKKKKLLALTVMLKDVDVALKSVMEEEWSSDLKDGLDALSYTVPRVLSKAKDVLQKLDT